MLKSEITIQRSLYTCGVDSKLLKQTINPEPILGAQMSVESLKIEIAYL